ncbi:MAG TPA: hypothetical protein VIH82_08945, partial [Acidimicrobiia bacterium]
MGAHRSRGGAPEGRGGARLTEGTAGDARVDRVVPDIPAIDRALDYTVPSHLEAAVELGTIVRVPLHGRRVRGWVVAVAARPVAPPTSLRPLMAAVSAGPSPELVDLTAYAAWRWAGPRTAFLRSASPPNVVEPGPSPEPDIAVFPPATMALDLPDAPVRLVVWPPAARRTELIAGLMELDGSTIVVAPDPTESDELAGALRAVGR